MSEESTGKVSSWVRSWDQTGVLVSMNLPSGDRDHKSTCGGCCSLFVIFITVLITISELSRVFIAIDFSTEQSFNYLNFSTNTEAYEIAAVDFIPAVQVVNFWEEMDNLTDYYDMKFYQYLRSLDSDLDYHESINFYDLDLCTKLYPELKDYFIDSY